MLNQVTALPLRDPSLFRQDGLFGTKRHECTQIDSKRPIDERSW